MVRLLAFEASAFVLPGGLVTAALLVCLVGCNESAPTRISESARPQALSEALQDSASGASTDEASENSSREIILQEPASYNPLVAGALLVPSKLPAPGMMTLLIRVKTAPGWHIYAADRPAGAAQPTRLELKLSDGVETVGDWLYPEASPGAGKGQAVYEGDFAFRRRLKVTDAAVAGQFKVECEIHYQACDPFSCRPPESLHVEVVAHFVPQR
jgi:DsbC/DsbD-like thiol-disulfide interchange protein